VLEALFRPHLRGTGIRATFLDYGLHRSPILMTPAIQERLDDLPQPSDVILGYGLCGNGLAGLKAGPHTLIVPRADDCIMMLLGSYQRYIEEFAAEPGTYYVSRGWLECGSHPLKTYQEYEEKYGRSKADWLIDSLFQNYRRLVLVASSRLELEQCRPEAMQVAQFCAQRWGMAYQEIIGSAGFVHQLISQGSYLRQSTEDILVIPPGGEIRQEMFFR
jgi:hypothetical protein